MLRHPLTCCARHTRCTAVIDERRHHFHPSLNLSVSVTDTSDCPVTCLRSGSHPRPRRSHRQHICHRCRPVAITARCFFFSPTCQPDHHTGLPFCFLYTPCPGLLISWLWFDAEVFFVLAVVLDAASCMLDLHRQMTSFASVVTCEDHASATVEQSHYIC